MYGKYYSINLILSKCLRSLDLNKTDYEFFLYLQEKSYMCNEIRKKSDNDCYIKKIDYNKSHIAKECWNNVEYRKYVNRSNLLSKGIIIEGCPDINGKPTKIWIEYNPKKWNLTSKEFNKIEEILNDKNNYKD